MTVKHNISDIVVTALRGGVFCYYYYILKTLRE
jgi:hypothetical protein